MNIALLCEHAHKAAESGGAAVLLPAAALFLGAAVLTYAMLRGR